jgi:hypothetical protein
VALRQVLRFPLPILIPPNAPYLSIIQSWYNRPNSGLLGLTASQEIKRKPCQDSRDSNRTPVTAYSRIDPCVQMDTSPNREAGNQAFTARGRPDLFFGRWEPWTCICEPLMRCLIALPP